MAAPHAESVLRSIGTLFHEGAVGLRGDGECLDRFLSAQGPAAETAFRVLVERHGPMTVALCRRVLGDVHDAEDAAQAAFLVLARKARSIRNRDAVAGFLFGTAHRIALRAKKDAARRREHERRRIAMDSRSLPSPSSAADLADLDAAISRLSEKHRAPLILCDLEGLTEEQAASRLDISLRTLQRNLAAARNRLRERLKGSEGAFLLALGARATQLSPSWIDATAKAAAGFASGSLAAGAISIGAKRWAEDSLRSLTMSKFRIAVTLLLLGAATIAGAIPLARGQKPNEPAKLAQANAEIPTTLTLTIRDAKTLKPIEGVSLKVGTAAAIKTDADGHASVPIRGDSRQELRIGVRKAGYVPALLSWVTPVPSADTLDLEPGAAVQGKVEDEDGRPIAGAKVNLSVLTLRVRIPRDVFDFRDEVIHTGADGRWSYRGMPLQGVRIRVQHPDYADETHDFRPGDIAPEGPNDIGVMRMAKGLTLSGCVLDPAGNPVAGAQVARGLNGFTHADAPWLETDRDGRFRVTQADRGSLVLTVRAKGLAPDMRTIEVKPALEPILVRLQPPNTIRGRVVDRDGRKIAGARVSIGSWRGLNPIPISTTTDDAGRFALEDAPADTVLLEARKEGYTYSFRNTVRAADEGVTITLNPPLKISGEVVDAETGRTIPEFTIIPGQPFDPTILWRDEAKTFTRGRYDVTYFYPSTPTRLLRVEAEGYLPAESPPFDSAAGGNQVHNFRLTQGKLSLRPAISGVVRKPDGSPAGGVTVHLATKMDRMYVRNGHDEEERMHPRTKAGTDGSFRFPPQAEPAFIVVLDNDGFGFAREAELAGSKDLKLVPWGRVEGEVRSGAGVVPRGMVALSPMGRTLDMDEHRMITLDTMSSADDKGRFTIERAIPGNASLARMVWVSPTSSSGQSPVMITVKPGETTRATVGGGGRDVVGRVVLPEGSRLVVDWTNSYSQFIGVLPEVPEPPNLSPRERKAWYTAWEGSPAGQAYLAAQRNRGFHAVAINADGSFRIEDVRLGTYSLRIEPHPPNRQGGALGVAQKLVTVPEIADGDLAKPLDLGPIELKPAGK